MRPLPPVGAVAGSLKTLFLAALCATVAPVHALDLVRDGKPVAVIVSKAAPEAPDARPAKGKASKKAVTENDEALAVRTLVEWVKKITDAELPVVDAAKDGAPAIYVGQAAVAAGLKLDDIQSESHEGLRVIADDKRVLVGGQNETATLKAVCRLLEELGCRYLMDGPLGEVYPRSQTLTVGKINLTEKPGLLWRNPKGPSWGARLWKAWNGAGGEAFGHSHSWGGYVSESLFGEHPEFFAMGADGQRKAGGWICTSNPALREHFAANVMKAIENGTHNPSLSPTDGRGYCQCPVCKAQDDPKAIEPSSGTVAVTNRYVDFFDAVGRIVAKKYPDSVLSFYCYADYTQPPTVRRELSPNLCAMIAPIRYCRLHPVGHPGCASREQQVALTDGWAGMAKRIGYYNYMYNLADGTLPMFKYSACQKEFPYLADKGLTYMTIEVLSNWHIYGPQIYLSLKMAYDPRADAAAIMDDYFLKFYGPKAGPPMKAYWMGIDAAQQNLQSHAGCFFGLAQIYTPEFLKTCDDLMAKAAAAAKGNEAYEQRVALHAEGLKSAHAYRSMSDAMNRGDFAAAESEYKATFDRLKALGESGAANREYGMGYLERMLSKPVRAGAAATAAPNRLVQVLPDRWRFSFDEADTGNDRGVHLADFKDDEWPLVATFNTTLDAQGFDKNAVMWYRTKFTAPAKRGKLALFFGEVDGKSEVYVNGQKVAVPEQYQQAKKPGAAVTTSAGGKPVREGMAKPRAPFEVDVTPVVKDGENLVALRVDHTTITDLALGGILRPVLLIEKPE